MGSFCGESGQHEVFQVLPVLDAQGIHGVGNVPFYRIEGHAQVVGDLLIGPSPGRQHGSGELGGGKVVRHMVPCIGVVDLAPTGGKTVGNVNDPLEVLRPFRLDDRFQHTAQPNPRGTARCRFTWCLPRIVGAACMRPANIAAPPIAGPAWCLPRIVGRGLGPAAH